MLTEHLALIHCPGGGGRGSGLEMGFGVWWVRSTGRCCQVGVWRGVAMEAVFGWLVCLAPGDVWGRRRGAGSGDEDDGAEPGERVVELFGPWPILGEVEGEFARGAGDRQRAAGSKQQHLCHPPMPDTPSSMSATLRSAPAVSTPASSLRSAAAPDSTKQT